MSHGYTRRRVLLGTSTLAAGMVGSIVVTSDNASAQVDGEFSVPNAETTVTDGTLQDIRLTADAAFSYDANVPIHGVELELHVGASPDTLDMIARHTREDLGTDQLDGSETLTGSIISASDFTMDNFMPTSGSMTTGVIAELRFYAIRDGEAVAEARQSESFEVTVTKEDLDVSVTTGGEGEVVFET